MLPEESLDEIRQLSTDSHSTNGENDGPAGGGGGDRINGDSEEFGAQIRFQDVGPASVSLLGSDINEELGRWFREDEVPSASAVNGEEGAAVGSYTASDSAAFDKAWQRLQETADDGEESVSMETCGVLGFKIYYFNLGSSENDRFIALSHNVHLCPYIASGLGWRLRR